MKNLVVFIFLATLSITAEVDECLQNLPYGCFLNQAVDIPAHITANIGKKLGVPIKSLSNNLLSVYGKQIKVNILETHSPQQAEKLYQTLVKMKGSPDSCVIKNNKVIEYVVNDLALARVTSYELGLLAKPKQINYRIQVHIAMVEKADYMALNPLFQALMAPNKDNAQIKQLTQRCTFGNNIFLRRSAETNYVFNPQEQNSTKLDFSTQKYHFSYTPKVFEMPYALAKIEVQCNDSGITEATHQENSKLLSSTEFWPSNDPEIVALAQKITSGKNTLQDKITAILVWLAPGSNIRYSGSVGSRWGVKKVLQQRYGHCWDFSDCFVTLCRASGIPARQVAGWLYGVSGHVWAEVLLSEKKWLQVDPTGGAKLNCGIYHIPYFTTETGEMPILYVSWPNIEILETK